MDVRGQEIIGHIFGLEEFIETINHFEIMLPPTLSWILEGQNISFYYRYKGHKHWYHVTEYDFKNHCGYRNFPNFFKIYVALKALQKNEISQTKYGFMDNQVRFCSQSIEKETKFLNVQKIQSPLFRGRPKIFQVLA